MKFSKLLSYKEEWGKKKKRGMDTICQNTPKLYYSVPNSSNILQGILNPFAKMHIKY